MALVIKLKHQGPSGAETYAASEPLEDLENPVFHQFVRPCIAEFTGTMIYTFFSCVALTQAPTSCGSLAVAVTNGAAFALVIALFGPISGGHFNPAITVGVWISGGIKFLLAIFCWVSQVLGGFIGALMVRGILPRSMYVEIEGGITEINDAIIHRNEAVFCEILLSYFLVQTVLLATVDTQGLNIAAPFSTGCCVVANTIIGHSITKASANPARSLGPAIANSVFGTSRWEYHWVYWVGPFIGAVIAAVLYRLVFARGEKRWFLKH